MRKVHVTTDGSIELLFEESDVRDVCRIMRCGEHAEECIRLMRKGAMECALCSSVLSALKKPCAKKEREFLSQAV